MQGENQIQEPIEAPPDPSETVNPSKKEKFDKWVLIGILAIPVGLMVIFGGFFAYGYFNSFKTKPKQAQVVQRVSPTLNPTATPTATLTPSLTNGLIKAVITPTKSATTGMVTVYFYQWKMNTGSSPWTKIPITDSNIGVHVTKDGVQTNYVGNPPSWTSPPLAPGDYNVSMDEPTNHPLRADGCTGNDDCAASSIGCSRKFPLKAGEHVIISCWYDNY